jgi:hypothetical protein
LNDLKNYHKLKWDNICLCLNKKTLNSNSKLNFTTPTNRIN